MLSADCLTLLAHHIASLSPHSNNREVRPYCRCPRTSAPTLARYFSQLRMNMCRTKNGETLQELQERRNTFFHTPGQAALYLEHVRYPHKHVGIASFVDVVSLSGGHRVETRRKNHRLFTILQCCTCGEIGRRKLRAIHAAVSGRRSDIQRPARLLEQRAKAQSAAPGALRGSAREVVSGVRPITGVRSSIGPLTTKLFSRQRG